MTPIHAHLYRLHSPDVADLEHYVPEQVDCFGLLLQAMIGSDDAPGEESFDFMVCTPKWFAAELQASNEPIAFGRHYLFLRHYDYELLRQVIESLCIQATGEDWKAVAGFLGRFGKCEFEDYRPYEPGVL
jgi:hypothetical protein